MASQSPAPAESVEPEDPAVKTEGDANETPETGVSNDDLKAMKAIVDTLTEYRDEDGHEVAALFQRMLNRRLIPDYFEVIKEPKAFSTIRSNILKKQYSSWGGFVRDVALISHNAQVYNRPSAPVYSDAITLREVFKKELEKLVEKKVISAEDAVLPDLGPLPEVEDSPPPGPDDEDSEVEAEAEDNEDEEDEEDEDEDSDDEGGRRRRRHRGRSSAAGTKSKAEDGSKEDTDAHKKRGRPPKVHTPMEARINSILKGLRKFKNPGGDLKILHFEKLPDKTVMPEYYQEIKNPMAMDLIKRKAKRKKYMSVDQAMKDLELMFDNAKAYNLEDSQVYKDAVDLQREARNLADQEKKKPDSDFVDEDGKLPLPEILHNGEIWKVGDWVHISNPNDLTKPIVAQIYRTWQDSEGQKWINACWYYRPEQTVHRHDKHFFENEVVKTGQYRDHHIDEVVDRCFVMFFTRFHKGRPRGFPPDKEVYVCEARYNEDKFKLNKIKTWASCVPDEVREKDYEMDLFDVPRKMKKVPSPIKHLLREDAKEDDPLPKPTWGAANAPPIVGAVHKRPREANESPPPEPTPSPPPQPAPEPSRRLSTIERANSYAAQGDGTMAPSQSPVLTTSASTHAAGPYGQQINTSRPSASPAPALTHQSSYGSHTSTHQTPGPQTPSYGASATHHPGYTGYSSASVAGSGHLGPNTAHSNSTPNPLSNYDPHAAYRAAAASAAAIQPHNSRTSLAAATGATHANAYNPPRPVEVYHLSDVANASIPADIRSQFHTDEQGRVLFFTAPPLDVPKVPSSAKKLGHSVEYLARKARDAAAKEAKAKEAEAQRNGGATATTTSPNPEQAALEAKAREKKRALDAYLAKAKEAAESWATELNTGTDEIYKRLYGDGDLSSQDNVPLWQIVRDQESARLREVQEQERKRKVEAVVREREWEEAKKIRIWR